ncbi:sensor histidine kinase [Lachnospiraceae bacterium OttesenSCG-928-D06]|nr:sensor histidine kinase [Lachnospiraceae bacterium OttesenSCG-928-D06]
MSRQKKLNLYQKFTLTIIIIGLIPMVILTTFIANQMIQGYREALYEQYEQAASYVASSLESMLDSYNTISQIPYSYNYSVDASMGKDYRSFDNLRQIIQGEIYDPLGKETERRADMSSFLKYVESVDNYIDGVHFTAREENGNLLLFNHSSYSTYFKEEELFLEVMDYENLDRESRKLILIPTHATGYFSGMSDSVFTIARNYYDLRGEVGNTPYVGTLFIDISLKRMAQLLKTVKFSGSEVFYVINQKGDCFYSSQEGAVSQNITDELGWLQMDDSHFLIESKTNAYGLQVVAIMSEADAFGQIRSMQNMMYLLIGVTITALLFASAFFSKQLTRPIHEMMAQMAQVESGQFDVELPVRSEDEIGILARRFNQMSQALEQYINQSYVAQIKQNEAELTAIKSQIYPHFLYNTLEIIRMTAIEEGGDTVAEMIEALSQQIHYLIGPVQDMVALEKEIDIVRRYVYLLNCRIAGKVQLSVRTRDLCDGESANHGLDSSWQNIMVPKLVLQPVVENAYIHGIKPKQGSGSIGIEAVIKEDILEISVMDNGVGMTADVLDRQIALLEGAEPGIKNQDNWQSIGLKNVHDRIRYLYGREYGIRITSTPDVGTLVRLLIPVAKETDNDKNDSGR